MVCLCVIRHFEVARKTWSRWFCIAEPREARGGGGWLVGPRSGMEGGRIRVNCVAWEGGFQHWLYQYWKARCS